MSNEMNAGKEMMTISAQVVEALLWELGGLLIQVTPLLSGIIPPTGCHGNMVSS